MYETHTQVTADSSDHPAAREPEPPAAGALTVRTERRAERRADVLVLWLSGALEEHDQRTSFRQGPHAGRLPLELTRDAYLRFQPVARRADASGDENFFAHDTQCADVDHQRPLVIDPEAHWMGASGPAAGASDAPSP